MDLVLKAMPAIAVAAVIASTIRHVIDASLYVPTVHPMSKMMMEKRQARWRLLRRTSYQALSEPRKQTWRPRCK